MGKIVKEGILENIKYCSALPTLFYNGSSSEEDDAQDKKKEEQQQITEEFNQYGLHIFKKIPKVTQKAEPQALSEKMSTNEMMD